MSPKVAIVMGSRSDLEIMKQASEVLQELGVESETKVISAHRTPDEVFAYGKSARDRGLKVIIAAAGGAAHLPGVIAALTTLPVIGVPIKAKLSIDGWDAVLSILQMPSGVPVATVALDGAKNAGILAAQILGVADVHVAKNLQKFKDDMKVKVSAS